MENIHTKLYEICTSGSGGDVILRHSLSRAMAAPRIIEEGIMRNTPVIFFLNLDLWFRRKCRLKVFLNWRYGSTSVQRTVTICAILVEDIKRNNSVKLF